MNFRERFDQLRISGESFCAELEKEIRQFIPNYQVFVNDQFEAAFPEDHLMRDGKMMLSLRLKLDLKGFGKPNVSRLKSELGDIEGQLKVLRSNFADSAEEIDFDWHLQEGADLELLRTAFKIDVSLLTQKIKTVAQ